MRYKVAMRLAQRIQKNIKVDGHHCRSYIVGSLRRGQKRIGDIDILIVTRRKIIKKVELVGARWVRRGNKLWAGRVRGVALDVFFCHPHNKACALFHHTGPASYNIRIRKYAKDNGYHLNQYGLWRHGKKIKTRTERDITRALGTTYYAPEKRK